MIEELNYTILFANKLDYIEYILYYNFSTEINFIWYKFLWSNVLLYKISHSVGAIHIAKGIDSSKNISWAIQNEKGFITLNDPSNSM